VWPHPPHFLAALAAIWSLLTYYLLTYLPTTYYLLLILLTYPTTYLRRSQRRRAHESSAAALAPLCRRPFVAHIALVTPLLPFASLLQHAAMACSHARVRAMARSHAR